MKKCYYKPTRKVKRVWTVRDLARIAQYLVEKGYSQDAITQEIFGKEGFTRDDTIREMMPHMSLLKTFRTTRRWIKFIVLLLGVIEVMTAGAAVPFLLPLQAELGLVLVGIGIFAAELRQLKKFVKEVSHLVGVTGEGDPITMDMPSEEEIDEAVKEADDAAGKLNKILDSMDVITD